MTMKKFFIFLLLSTMLASCSEGTTQIGDFSVDMSDETDIFENIQATAIPDGLWLLERNEYILTDESGHIEDAFLVEEAVSSEGYYRRYFLCEGNFLKKTYIRFVYTDRPSDDLSGDVHQSEPEATKGLALSVDGRTATCEGLEGDRSILVTELSENTFSYIYPPTMPSDGEKYRFRKIYKKISDTELLEFLETGGASAGL